MRALLLLTAMALGSCASQPSALQTKPATDQAVSSSAPGNPSESIEAQRLAAARNLNLKVIDKNGQQLFCRSNQMTATRIQRDVTCYTADQLDRMQAQMERDLDQINSHPSQSPGMPSH